MTSQGGFLDKLVMHMNRLDSESLQTQFLGLVKERGLLETIFQSIQEGVIVVSADGRLFYANHAAEDMFGFKVSRMRGRPITRYIPDIDWESLAGRDEDEWVKLSTSEVEIFRPQRRVLSISAVPLEESPEGAGSCVVAILRDVTREREDAAAMVESERMQAIRILGASLAHEIGNPLNALGIHLQLLERDVKGLPDDSRERIGELVSIARDEVSRLDLMISKFLRALRPSAPVLEKCDMTKLVQESLRVMRSEISEHNIEVALISESELPPVMADSQHMKQAFFNLVKNAMQAMSDGGRLEIRLVADDRDLTISFKDSGSGMDKDVFNRLFEPFLTNKAKGAGLGLMIVQRIVQDHGGRLDVSTKQGTGSCFRIILPLANRKARMLPANSTNNGGFGG